jgi:hypothetical protein
MAVGVVEELRPVDVAFQRRRGAGEFEGVGD